MAERWSGKIEAFCRHYVETLDGSEAARRAGYAASHVRTQAWKLMRRQDVRDEIMRLQKELARNTGITPERVAFELFKTGLMARASGQYGQAVSALRQVGEHLGMFDESAPAAGAGIGTGAGGDAPQSRDAAKGQLASLIEAAGGAHRAPGTGAVN